MTTIREALRRLLTRNASPPNPDYSYTIYWMKVARSWEGEFRRKAMQELELLFGQPDFEANEFERRFRLTTVDASRHSGASLLALHKVLQALGESELQRR